MTSKLTSASDEASSSASKSVSHDVHSTALTSPFEEPTSSDSMALGWLDSEGEGLKSSELYGKFTWKIETFSEISKRELRSNIFVVGGFKWYILVYPQGCDVCNHLSLFLCVADYDKLLPGWNHFAQFTIAVVNKDPKKSKYSDTLHRFCKKEHDWGWKKFMELSKVLDGFTVSDTLVIKAQVQVIREKPERPFRCLDWAYRRELVRVYLANVENICRRFVDEKREKLAKLLQDPSRWASLRSFWNALDEDVRARLARERCDVILKALVKRFFNDKEVTSTLVMDALYTGCRELQVRAPGPSQGSGESVEVLVWVERRSFVLSTNILALMERAVSESIPQYKDDKQPHNRAKDFGTEEGGKEVVENDERRLTELGRRTVEMFVLAHLFNNRVEVAYREAVALKRQEELIREEEAAEKEQVARKEQAEKDKRQKKKQAKQRKKDKKVKKAGAELEVDAEGEADETAELSGAARNGDMGKQPFQDSVPASSPAVQAAADMDAGEGGPTADVDNDGDAETPVATALLVGESPLSPGDDEGNEADQESETTFGEASRDVSDVEMSASAGTNHRSRLPNGYGYGYPVSSPGSSLKEGEPGLPAMAARQGPKGQDPGATLHNPNGSAVDDVCSTCSSDSLQLGSEPSSILGVPESAAAQPRGAAAMACSTNVDLHEDYEYGAGAGVGIGAAEEAGGGRKGALSEAEAAIRSLKQELLDMQAKLKDKEEENASLQAQLSAALLQLTDRNTSSAHQDAPMAATTVAADSAAATTAAAVVGKEPTPPPTPAAANGHPPAADPGAPAGYSASNGPVYVDSSMGWMRADTTPMPSVIQSDNSSTSAMYSTAHHFQPMGSRPTMYSTMPPSSMPKDNSSSLPAGDFNSGATGLHQYPGVDYGYHANGMMPAGAYSGQNLGFRYPNVGAPSFSYYVTDPHSAYGGTSAPQHGYGGESYSQSRNSHPTTAPAASQWQQGKDSSAAPSAPATSNPAVAWGNGRNGMEAGSLLDDFPHLRLINDLLDG